MSGWSQAGSASGHGAGGLSGRSGALGGGVGSVRGQGRGAAALDMDREILEPQGGGPLNKRALGAWREDSGEAWSWEMRRPACPLVPPCKGGQALGSGSGS